MVSENFKILEANHHKLIFLVDALSIRIAGEVRILSTSHAQHSVANDH